eukprot:scaffold926_cov408-Prasinococcus_capsulatus_cf.AAC.33
MLAPPRRCRTSGSLIIAVRWTASVRSEVPSSAKAPMTKPHRVRQTACLYPCIMMSIDGRSATPAIPHPAKSNTVHRFQRRLWEPRAVPEACSVEQYRDTSSSCRASCCSSDKDELMK